jgi:hypothetical protein
MMPIFAINGASASADPAIGLNFTGSSASASTSWNPDSMGAVGPNHIVEMNNTTFRVYDKHTGRRLSASGPESFWSLALGFSISSNVDPRVVYDPTADRWYATMIDNNDLATQRILLGVSKGSDPTPIANSSTRGWRAFALDGDPTSQPNTHYPDYPVLGFDADTVILNRRLFNIQGSTAPAGWVVNVFPKTDLLAAIPTIARASNFSTLLPITQKEMPLQSPVIDTGPSDGRSSLYGITVADGIKRYEVVHGSDGSTISTEMRIPTPPFEPGPDAVQKGTTLKISNFPGSGSGRSIFQSALTQQGNHVWGAHTVKVGSRSGVRWYDIDESTNAIVQSGTITDAGLDLIDPSMAVNQFGDVVIGFTASGQNKYASAYAVVGDTIDGITTFGALMQLKEGKGTWYDGDEGDPRNRWGDYSTTVVDPSDPYHFWTFQEFTTATNTWGEQITEIIVPEPAGMWILVLSAIPMLLTRRLRGSTARLLGVGLMFLFALLTLPTKPAQADPTIGLNFTGATGAPGSFIPDTMGAVGRDYIVEMNDYYIVYEKATGKVLLRTSLLDFWRSAGQAGASDSAFDPRVVYDPTADRWYAAAYDFNRDPRTQIYLGVSASSDPRFGANKGWKSFSLDGDPTSDTNPRFAHFPTLGFNAEGVYLSANIEDNPNVAGVVPPGNFVVSIPKADLLKKSPSLANRSLFIFDAAKDLGGAYTAFQPVLDSGSISGPAPLFVINPKTGLKRWDITNAGNQTPNGAQLTGPVDIAIPAFSIAPTGNQPGNVPNLYNFGPFTNSNGLKIADLHRFTSHLVKQGNSVWGVHDVEAGGHAGVRWYEIDATTSQVLQWGTIADPALDLIYPSIAVNPFGDVVIGFTATGEQEFPSAYAAVGDTVNGVTTFGPLMKLKAGKATFTGVDGSGRNRWGDYSQTMLDPSDPYHFWTFQEIPIGGNLWGEQITEIIVPEPAAIWAIGLIGLAACRRWRQSGLRGRRN